MKFTEILESKGVEWHPGSKEGEININCPFCGDNNETEDTKFRLGINLIKGFAKCFNCDWGSKHGTTEKVLEKLSIEDSAEEGVEEPDEKLKNKVRTFDGKLPEEFEYLWPKKKDKDFKRAYTYLRERGISSRQIRRYRIGFCLAGKYAYRIVFPVYHKKKLVGLVSRDFTDRQFLRYKNSPGTKTLYGIKRKRKRNKIALLVEGIFDCLAAERILRKFGIDVLAILGKSLKDSQVKLLSTYEKIILVPDDDRDGLLGAVKIAKKLADADLIVEVSFLNSKYKDISKAYELRDKKAIRKLRHSKSFNEALESRIRLKVAVDYRGGLKE